MTDAVSFSRNIRPLFTAMDIEHMRRAGVALDDIAYMSDPNHAESVCRRLPRVPKRRSDTPSTASNQPQKRMRSMMQRTAV